MEKYKKYYGVIIFAVSLILLIVGVTKLVTTKASEMQKAKEAVVKKEAELKAVNDKLKVVKNKIKTIKDSIGTSQKKVYSPAETDLGNDTIFFTLYNDVIEMVHGNSVKIRTISYTPNPESDSFVQFGKDVYYVCDVNMELVSNYVNLGKLIQDLYQYPYYIKINELEVKPYQKDKKVLISNLSLRLYAHTAPEEEVDSAMPIQ